jgi:hypothetical protein
LLLFFFSFAKKDETRCFTFAPLTYGKRVVLLAMQGEVKLGDLLFFVLFFPLFSLSSFFAKQKRQEREQLTCFTVGKTSQTIGT